jgi:hypothetical protein
MPLRLYGNAPTADASNAADQKTEKINDNYSMLRISADDVTARRTQSCIVRGE